MQSLRSRMSDVQALRPAMESVVFDALKLASLMVTVGPIARSLRSDKERMKSSLWGARIRAVESLAMMKSVQTLSSFGSRDR